VYFPRLTTPISNVLSAVIQFGVQMVMVLIFLVYYLIRGEVTVMLLRWLWIPLVLLHLGLLGMGFGIIVSSLTTKYRDLSVLVGFGVQLWMYATPVVYPISEITEGWMRAIIMINPVTPSVELLRYAMLGQGTVNWAYYGLSWLMTIAIAFLGIIIFNKVEKTFMDTV
jgi:lipopolysaccharide transport system permease protein